MADGQQVAIDETFVQAVRFALQHLYDWEVLRRSPMAAAFGLNQQDDLPVALSHILTDAIEDLRPDAEVPLRAKAWRRYRLLYSRFTEQLSQTETASDLGLSVRHLRREETDAVDTLASHLWHRHHLAARWRDVRPSLSPAQALEPADGDQTPSVGEELSWLEESLASETVEVADLLESVIELLRPLAESEHVAVQCEAASVPPVVAQRMPIRQALVTIAEVAIRAAPNGSVTFSTHAEQAEVLIHIEARGPHSKSGADVQDPALDSALESVRRLVELSQGSLELLTPQVHGQRFLATIALPARERIPVLVIDDNADTRQLLERYLADTRYRFEWAADADRALEMAEAVAPQAIILDLMLPTVDGWELLGRLRQRSCTQGVPILVCSILPLGRLAAALGATGFLQKPVSRGEFLAALDHHLGLQPIGSG